MKIVVSDAHWYGHDSGATALGHVEALDSMKIDDYLIPMLQKQGHQIIRLAGSLQSAINWMRANRGRFDLAIEIHKNAGGGTGVEVVYDDADPRSKQRARIMSSKIAGITGLVDRGAKPDSATPRKHLGFVESPGEGFIIEEGFIDSGQDNAVSIWRYAYAVAQAIKEAY